jgi:hypothetical protein
MSENMSEDTNPYDQMTPAEQEDLNKLMMKNVHTQCQFTLSRPDSPPAIWNTLLASAAVWFTKAVATTSAKNAVKEGSFIDFKTMIASLEEHERDEWINAVKDAVEACNWRSFFEICEYHFAANTATFSLNDCSKTQKHSKTPTTYRRALAVSPDC